MDDVISVVNIIAYLLAAIFVAAFVWLAKNVMFPDTRWRGLKISPHRLILFRLYNLTVGSSAIGSGFLRWVLTRVLIHGKKGQDTYCQSAAFFTYDQLRKKE